MVASFEWRLKRKSYPVSIISDLAFEKLRKTLYSKQKQLKKQGKGKKPLLPVACMRGGEWETAYNRDQILVREQDVNSVSIKLVLTLMMTSAQVVETSVTQTVLLRTTLTPDDHTSPTRLGLKKLRSVVS